MMSEPRLVDDPIALFQEFLGFSGMTTPVRRIILVAAWFTMVVAASSLSGQQPGGASPSQPVAYEAKPGTDHHPLAPIQQWAKQEIAGLEKSVVDYSAVLVSRERADGKLGDYESTMLKVRHRPFSVYARIETPADHKDDEAIYVEGRNDGKLLGHTTGMTGRLVGTVSLDPAGSTAMDGQHHPITEIGMLNLCRRLLRYVESDMRFAECEVQTLRGVKINGRPCSGFEIAHPVAREHFAFHRVRVFIDDQLRLPVRYEQYDWPKEGETAPALVEEYTYVNIKLNNGFTDDDFDTKNPNYGFP
jgi:hypothetical protein